MSDAAPMPPDEPTPSAPPGLSGQTLASGLVVLSRLCESSEGRLYAAIAPSGKEVTLLVLSAEGQGPSLDGPDLLARVRQRAREERLDKVKAIHHPNIAEIYGTDVAPDGTPCVVMEQFSGEPISAILAARGAVPLSAAIDLSQQAAAGLAAAHAAGVVHGNVSPETMLLTRTALGHRLKLIGFSLGLFVGGSRNGLRENARYASPEQRCGVAADEQSDVYSLAAVLHHLVSGAPPEAGGVEAESIPRRLKAVLAKALADGRSDRYPTMAAFVAALERASGPDDVREEVRGGLSRLVGLAAAIAVVAGVWLLWGSRQAGMRAEAEARRTERTQRTQRTERTERTPQPVPAVGGSTAAASADPRPAPSASPESPHVMGLDSVDFGPVEGGVSYAEAPKPIKKTEPMETMQPTMVVKAEPVVATPKAATPPPPDFSGVRGGFSWRTQRTQRTQTTQRTERTQKTERTEKTEKTEKPRPTLAKTESPKVAKATPPKLETIASAKTEPANAEPPQPRMSPFRRSHPWAAYPEGKFYYSSSCPGTLEFDDLVYFASEKEAQAAGYLPAHGSRCP